MMRGVFKVLLNLTVCVSVLSMLSAPVYGSVTYQFSSITNNSVLDAATGAAQLSVEVSDAGNNQVLFTFWNIGTEDCSITDVYFDDGTLLGIAQIMDNPAGGVSFSQYATPQDLPGGNDLDVPFETTAGFSADSDPKVQPNGVNPGESLGIVFDLLQTYDSQGDPLYQYTYEDTLAAISMGLASPENTDSLRIGIHVQGFDGGGSESFVIVPAPGALFLASIGLVAISRIRRRILE